MVLYVHTITMAVLWKEYHTKSVERMEQEDFITRTEILGF